MQGIHPINNGSVGVGGGRLFGDRRLRPHNHHPNNQQSLNCPRCDSLNTKFCYYNNYNLSQPRHFCKNCRRYWTNGGVLRNVPVGGGCRKSKRSAKPKTRKAPRPSRSSSESESNNTAVAVAITDVTASAVNGGGNYGGVDNINKNNSVLFSGEFMSLMNNHHNCCSTATDTASFSQLLQSQSTEVGIGVDDWEWGKVSGAHEVENDKMSGVLDPTVTIEDLLENRGGTGGVATLDWEQHPTVENGDQGLFDFTSAVDHQGYWSQPTSTIWSHNNTSDHTLFLP